MKLWTPLHQFPPLERIKVLGTNLGLGFTATFFITIVVSTHNIQAVYFDPSTALKKSLLLKKELGIAGTHNWPLAFKKEIDDETCTNGVVQGSITTQIFTIEKAFLNEAEETILDLEITLTTPEDYGQNPLAFIDYLEQNQQTLQSKKNFNAHLNSLKRLQAGHTKLKRFLRSVLPNIAYFVNPFLTPAQNISPRFHRKLLVFMEYLQTVKDAIQTHKIRLNKVEIDQYAKTPFAFIGYFEKKTIPYAISKKDFLEKMHRLQNAYPETNLYKLFPNKIPEIIADIKAYFTYPQEEQGTKLEELKKKVGEVQKLPQINDHLPLTTTIKKLNPFSRYLCYEILGLDSTASQEAIRKAYRALAKKYHTDRNKHLEALKLHQILIAAYQILTKKDE